MGRNDAASPLRDLNLGNWIGGECRDSVGARKELEKNSLGGTNVRTEGTTRTHRGAEDIRMLDWGKCIGDCA